jgi:cyclopropane-fatty-acyl-phospholipid synthase
VTLSQGQADLARKQVADDGVDHLVEIRVQDYREVHDGPYDAICSIGMAEHVGRADLPAYARGLLGLLAPQGRLLHHAIADRRKPEPDTVSFIEAYVFPNGELSRIGDTVSALEVAGLEVRDVQSLREHYSLTLRAWVRRLDDHWTEAVAMVGERRARIWRLYMIGSAVAFDIGRVGVDQVLAVRADEGRSGMPLVRERWLAN